jgi:hypothetical protein
MLPGHDILTGAVGGPARAAGLWVMRRLLSGNKFPQTLHKYINIMHEYELTVDVNILYYWRLS